MGHLDELACLRIAAHTLDWRNAVAQALHATGLRPSAARGAVLDWIATSERPFSAELIVQQVVLGWGLGSRPTVYRTIDWLRSAGWLARLHADSGERAYVRSLPGGYPLVCTSCGGVQTLTGLDLTPLFTAQLQTLGFELRGQHLELYGRCQRCQLETPNDYASHLEEDFSL